MKSNKLNLVPLNAEELVSIDGGRSKLPVGTRRPLPITKKIAEMVMDFLDDIF